MITKDFESGQTEKSSRSWTARGREPADRQGEVALHRQMAAGFAVIATRRPLLRATVTSVVSYAGIGMLLACCPVLGMGRAQSVRDECP